MWIVMYVAMIASLKAMGFIPDSTPEADEEERTPWSD
jgi:hypothetical protein